jgi:phage protein D
MGWLFYCLPGTRDVYCGPVGAYLSGGVLNQEFKFVYRLSPYADPEKGDKLSNVIKNNLKFKESGKYSKVIVTLTDKEFKKESVTGEYGTDGGKVLRKSFAESLSDKSQTTADERAEELFRKENSGGYEGDMNVFGNPFICPEHAVQLEDVLHPEREGEYTVEKLIHNFSASKGFKTRIYLAKSFQEDVR